MLKISCKIFLKNVSCYPQKINKNDIIALREIFSYEEVFHLILLASTVKSRIQMTYFSKVFKDITKGDF